MEDQLDAIDSASQSFLLCWGHVIHHVNMDNFIIFHILFFFSGSIEPNIMLDFTVSKDCASYLKYVLEVVIKMFVSLIFHNFTILKYTMI